MSDSQCKHEKMRKECWSAIYLLCLRVDMEEAVSKLIGVRPFCTECLKHLDVTREWLYVIEVIEGGDK